MTSGFIKSLASALFAVGLLGLTACGARFDAQPAEAAQVESIAPVTPVPAPADWPEQAPDVFKVRFETTSGVFVAQFHREWAPIGVEHLYQLVRAHYYDGNRFFRVVPGFIVQFGLHGDPAVNRRLGSSTIKDDPRIESNGLGTIAFAQSSQPHSRSTQLFVNLTDNFPLDQSGFTPLGKVIEGLNAVRAINAQYGEKPDQRQIRAQGNAYLDEAYPRLDFIVSAQLVR